jgi:hypothetical protein
LDTLSEVEGGDVENHNNIVDIWDKGIPISHETFTQLTVSKDLRYRLLSH